MEKAAEDRMYKMRSLLTIAEPGPPGAQVDGSDPHNTQVALSVPLGILSRREESAGSSAVHITKLPFLPS